MGTRSVSGITGLETPCAFTSATAQNLQLQRDVNCQVGDHMFQEDSENMNSRTRPWKHDESLHSHQLLVSPFIFTDGLGIALETLHQGLAGFVKVR